MIIEIKNNIEKILNDKNLSDKNLKFRKKQIEIFLNKGFPNKKIEEWKYSDLDQIIKKNITKINYKLNNIKKNKFNNSDIINDFEHNKIIYVNGKIIKFELPFEDDRNIEIYDDQNFDPSKNPINSLINLNNALTFNYSKIKIKKNYCFKRPLIIYHFDTKELNSSVINFRCDFELDENSSLDVINVFKNYSENNFININHQFNVGKNSNIKNYVVDSELNSNIKYFFNNIDLENNSYLESFIFSRGSKFLRNEINCNLNDKYSSAFISGIIDLKFMNKAKAIENQKELFGHPLGLYILFFTELWERFSYYGMRALFTLFLVAETTSDNPGFGWTNEEALALYGWYTMLVYVSSIPGGWVADKLLGQKKTVMLGGILLCIGHSVLAFDSEISFYIGCLFIILGVGGLKPNISSMVGGLYKQGDERRDLGFYIFYMGINIGGFLAPILCGILAQKYGWHYGFGLAAIGMFLGQVVYIWGQKHLKHVGNLISRKNEADKAILDKPLTSIEKDRIKVLLLSFLLIILFWAAFEQAGGLMNLYAQQKTDRTIFGMTIPASVFQSVNSFFIITLATVVGRFWYKWKQKGNEASSIFKMAVGHLF